MQIKEELTTKFRESQLQKALKDVGPIAYAPKDTLKNPELIDWQQVAVVIPAYNEADTIAKITKTVSNLNPGRLIVVDNNSSDATTQKASAAGAEVVACPVQGKAHAMTRGVEATSGDTPVILFLDGDLTGLKPEHLQALVAPFFAEEELPNIMTLGACDRGTKQNEMYWYHLPFLTGQRALLRNEFLTTIQQSRVKKWQMEATLNAHFKNKDLPIRPMILSGVFHRPKDEKHETPAKGHWERIKMLTAAIWGYVKFPFRKVTAGVRRLQSNISSKSKSHFK